MIILNKLRLVLDGEQKNIYFGAPDNEKELEEMFRLRYRIYCSKNYINGNLFPDGLEKDEYDLTEKSRYFIAKIDEKIIGTARIITNYFLPTEKECFKFEEPEDIKKIPREKRMEFSRLIIIPPDEKKYLPRNIVLLFLVKSIMSLASQKGITGGYAFIKNRLKIKLMKLKFPIHIIDDYIQVYPVNGLLAGYFNQPDDPVVPIYFLKNEFENYYNKILNSRMFSKISDSEYFLKNTLYNKFLKFLKIL